VCNPYPTRVLRQYRTILRISTWWRIATLALALAGTVFHFFEVEHACADILGVNGPVDAHVAMRAPGRGRGVPDQHPACQVRRDPDAHPRTGDPLDRAGHPRRDRLPVGYRHIRKQIERGRIDL
jgi:hypothetical protein